MKNKIIIIFVFYLISLAIPVSAAGEEVLLRYIDGAISPAQLIQNNPEFNKLVSLTNIAADPTSFINGKISGNLMSFIPQEIINLRTNLGGIQDPMGFIRSEVYKNIPPELTNAINNFNKYKGIIDDINKDLPDKLMMEITKDGRILIKSRSMSINIIEISPYSFWEISSFDKKTKEILLIRNPSKFDNKPIVWNEVIKNPKASISSCLANLLSNRNKEILQEDYCKEIKICYNKGIKNIGDISTKLTGLGTCDSIKVMGAIDTDLTPEGGNLNFNYLKQDFTVSSKLKIKGKSHLKIINPNQEFNFVSNIDTLPAEIKINGVFSTSDKSIKNNNIDYAYFKSLPNSGDMIYIFFYNKKKYIYTVNKGAIVLFDPKNGKLNIKGIGKIDFDGSKIISVSEKELNLKLNSNGDIIQIDYPAGGEFEYKEYGIGVTSQQQFSICFGSKTCASNSLAIEHLEGMNVLRSQGLITYNVGLLTEVTGTTADTKTTLIQAGDYQILSVQSGIANAKKDRIEAKINAQKKCCSPTMPFTGSVYKIWETPKKDCGTQVTLERNQPPTLPTEFLEIVDNCVSKEKIPATRFVISPRGTLIGENPIENKPLPNLKGTFDPEEQNLNLENLKGKPIINRELVLIGWLNALMNDMDNLNKKLRSEGIWGTFFGAIELYNVIDYADKKGSWQTREEAINRISEEKAKILSLRNLLVTGFYFIDPNDPNRGAASTLELNKEFTDFILKSIKENGEINADELIAYSNRIIDTEKKKGFFVSNRYVSSYILNQASFFAETSRNVVYYKNVGPFGSVLMNKKGEDSLFYTLLMLTKDKTQLEKRTLSEIASDFNINYDENTNVIYIGSNLLFDNNAVCACQPFNKKNPCLLQKKLNNINCDQLASQLKDESLRIKNIYNSEPYFKTKIDPLILRIRQENSKLVLQEFALGIIDIFEIAGVAKIAVLGVRDVVKAIKLVGKNYGSILEYIDNLKNGFLLIRQERLAYAQAVSGGPTKLTSISSLDEARKATLFNKMDDIVPGGGRKIALTITSKFITAKDLAFTIGLPDLTFFTKLEKSGNNLQILQNTYESLIEAYKLRKYENYKSTLTNMEKNLLPKINPEFRNGLQNEINLLKRSYFAPILSQHNGNQILMGGKSLDVNAYSSLGFTNGDFLMITNAPSIPSVTAVTAVGLGYSPGDKILWFGKKNGQVKKLASVDLDNMIAFLKMQPGADELEISKYLNKIDDKYFSLLSSKGKFKYSFSGADYYGNFEVIPLSINEISKL